MTFILKFFNYPAKLHLPVMFRQGEVVAYLHETTNNSFRFLKNNNLEQRTLAQTRFQELFLQLKQKQQEPILLIA